MSLVILKFSHANEIVTCDTHSADVDYLKLLSERSAWAALPCKYFFGLNGDRET